MFLILGRQERTGSKWGKTDTVYRKQGKEKTCILLQGKQTAS